MKSKSLFRRILHNLRSILRPLIFKLYLHSHVKIVVASVGRSGSSVLTDQIANAYFSKYLPKFLWPLRKLLIPCICEYCDYLNEITIFSGPIIKTHDQYSAPLNVAVPVKFIFIYCDPLESALSVSRQRYLKSDEWVASHIEHLRGEGSPEDIFYRDALNFKNQIVSWFKSPALKIKYPDFWDDQDSISRFLELDINLPLYIERSIANGELPNEYNKQMFEDLRQLLRSYE